MPAPVAVAAEATARVSRPLTAVLFFVPVAAGLVLAPVPDAAVVAVRCAPLDGSAVAGAVVTEVAPAAVVDVVASEGPVATPLRVGCPPPWWLGNTTTSTVASTATAI